LSALGPGGLSRERAGFEVRDVHRSHYGRICPIATPEGPNIGLVGHLSSYARIDEYGFLQTPFRKVINKVNNIPNKTKGYTLRESIKDPQTRKVIFGSGMFINDTVAKKLAKYKSIKEIKIIPVVTSQVVYLDAFTEEKVITTAANTPVDENGHFIEKQAEIRVHGQPTFDDVEKIDYMDVAPNQIISIATSLIPFLEHDDAVRALMGSNMQRQSVSLINPQAPIIGTGG